jgi:hypothetical protein
MIEKMQVTKRTYAQALFDDRAYVIMEHIKDVDIRKTEDDIFSAEPEDDD